MSGDRAVKRVKPVMGGKCSVVIENDKYEGDEAMGKNALIMFIKISSALQNIRATSSPLHCPPEPSLEGASAVEVVTFPISLWVGGGEQEP